MRSIFRLVTNRRHTDPCLHDMVGLESPWRLDGTAVRLVHNEHGVVTHLTGLRWHRDGVSWRSNPLPAADHECVIQTCELTTELMHEDRCSCGGVRYGNGEWGGRNSRTWP